jgi:hypothetical protein
MAGRKYGSVFTLSSEILSYLFREDVSDAAMFNQAGNFGRLKVGFDGSTMSISLTSEEPNVPHYLK